MRQKNYKSVDSLEIHSQRQYIHNSLNPEWTCCFKIEFLTLLVLYLIQYKNNVSEGEIPLTTKETDLIAEHGFKFQLKTSGH